MLSYGRGKVSFVVMDVASCESFSLDQTNTRKLNYTSVCGCCRLLTCAAFIAKGIKLARDLMNNKINKDNP